MEIPLSQLGKRKIAKITSLAGGFGLQKRLLALGIRIGKKIKVVSSQPFRGPLVVEIDGMRIAIGRGMANKIIVEVETI